MGQIVRLSESKTGQIVRLFDDKCFVDAKKLSVEAGEISVVTITRQGTFTDPRYGEVSLTQEMFESLITNFNNNSYGQDIFLDLSHEPANGAAATVKRLFTDGKKLCAEVEWYQFGIDAVKKKGMKYLSAEIHPNYIDNETGQEYGPTLLGAALTPRPCIKHLDAVQLSESTYLSEQLTKNLELSDMLKKYLLLLTAAIKGLALSEAAKAKFIEFGKTAFDGIEDEAKAKIILSELTDTAKAAVGTPAEAINLNMPGLGEADVLALMAKQRQKEQDTIKKLSEQKGANIKKYSDAINGSEGLDDDIKTILLKSTELITGEMADSQIVALSQGQITFGNQLAAQKKLQGFGADTGAVGSLQLGQPSSSGLKLQELVHAQLKNTSAFALKEIKLSEKLIPFASQVLGQFDQLNQSTIASEVKKLSDSNTSMSDVDLPIGFQREVLRESLCDLNILNLVQTLVDATATATTQIPYELRDVSGVLNQGVVFERQGIHKSKVSQRMDLAYAHAMKIAFDVTGEVMHFSRSSVINWDAWARNIATAARVMRELLAARLANEMQRIADANGAVAIVGEDIAAQLDGAKSVIKTAKFPIVQPFQECDLQGNAINAEENPIVLVITGTTITPFDGSGKQAAGTYYQIINHNLGYILLVDEAGEVVTPDSAAATISYSHATNIVKFDLDVPAETTLEKHLNGVLQKIGSAKAAMKSDLFVKPDFLLMSSTVNDICTNAEAFTVSAKRDGSDTNSEGDLEKIKSIAAYSSDQPGIHLGDERIIMGQKGALSYVVVKPFTLSEIQEGRDENGVLNDTKECYGTEMNAIRCPLPLRNRFKSIILYSATNR